LHFRNCQLKVLRPIPGDRAVEWTTSIAHKAACKNQSEDDDIDRISWPTRRARMKDELGGQETAVNLLIALCPLAIIPEPVAEPENIEDQDQDHAQVLILVLLLLASADPAAPRHLPFDFAVAAVVAFVLDLVSGRKTFAVCQYKSNYRKCGLDVIPANEQLRLLQVSPRTN